MSSLIYNLPVTEILLVPDLSEFMVAFKIQVKNLLPQHYGKNYVDAIIDDHTLNELHFTFKLPLKKLLTPHCTPRNVMYCN